MKNLEILPLSAESKSVLKSSQGSISDMPISLLRLCLTQKAG